VEAPAFPTQKLKVFNQKAVDWCGIQSQLPLGVDREITTGLEGFEGLFKQFWGPAGSLSDQ
jgi:hypothetical protein